MSLKSLSKHIQRAEHALLSNSQVISVNDLKAGTYFQLDNHLYQVLTYSHHKMGRGGAIIKTKLKDLLSGATLERTFKSSQLVEEAVLERKKVQFLYTDLENSYFMDVKTFEQYHLSNRLIGELKKFLKEGLHLSLLVHNDHIVNISLAIKEVYAVIEAPPGIKGDTVQGGSKVVIIETGAKILVPLFIKVGDKIKVNTLDGSYVERVS